MSIEIDAFSAAKLLPLSLYCCSYNALCVIDVQGIPFFLIYSLFMESVVTLVTDTFVNLLSPIHIPLSIAQHPIDVIYYGNWKMKEMKAEEKNFQIYK